MTAKVFIENKLVKTVYYQRNRYKKGSIAIKLAKLHDDIATIGLPFRIIVADKSRV